MNGVLDMNTEALFEEIARYLAAVDLFRAEGREPTWRPELVPAALRATPAAMTGLLPTEVGLY